MNAIPNEIREKRTVTARVGFFLLFLYLLMTFSRTIEQILPPFHLTAILYGLTLVFAVITGGLARAFSHRIGKYLAAFCVWLIVAVPFSMWKGGSVATLADAARTIPVFLLIVGLVRDFADTRRAIHALAFATLLLSIYTFFHGEVVDGRLELTYGKFANPNDLAQVLLMGLPFWWLTAADTSIDKIRRIAAAAAGILSLGVMARTGSRAALLATAVTMLVFLFKASNRSRLIMAAGAVIGLIIAAIALPDDLRARYFTLFEAGDEQQMSEQEQTRLDMAIGSAYARAHLLEASINLTITHPIFGVGPGMFQVGEQDLATSMGERPSWHESHNSYTQVSSEAGLPALFFYMAVLVLSLKITFGIYRRYRARPDCRLLANTAFAVQLSLISYAVATFFVSVAYDLFLPCLAGLSVCLDRAAAAQENRKLREPAPAAAAASAARPAAPKPEPRRRRLVSP
jgi:O-antigen ligase